MRKKTLRKRLAKTERKLEKTKTELRHTKDRLNAIIAGPKEDDILIADEPAPETDAGRLEKFLHP